MSNDVHKGLGYWKLELAALFPDDPLRVRTFFAAALNSEHNGDDEKAAQYLDKGIAAEDNATT